MHPVRTCNPSTSHNHISQVATIVEEFFASGDVDNAATSLEDLEEPDLLHYFVKRLIVLAFDRKDKEREMASMLLSNLYAEVRNTEG